MKKGLRTKRMLAVALTIAMLLQNSAGVLATDGVAPVSDATQGQSVEQQNTDAAPKQTDAGNSQQETKAPETPSPETPAQTEAPQQTDAPKTEATETDAPKTETTEPDAPQTDAPKTSAPETQETPGLTLPDEEKDNEMSNSGSSNGNGDASGSGSTVETGTTGTESETEPAQTTAPEQPATEKETNGSAGTNVYTAKVENTSVQVKVRGEGVLPEGSTMTAEAVAISDVDGAAQTIAERLHEEGQSLLGVEAFDITLLDENGAKLHQLDGKVIVEMEGLTVPEDAEQIRVYHVPETGEPEQVKSLVREELTDGILRFETDHFSVYAVTYVKGEDPDAGIMPIAGENVTLTLKAIIMDTPDGGGEPGGGTLAPNSASVSKELEIVKRNGDTGNSHIVLSTATAQSGYYFIDWAWEKEDGSYTHISDDKELDYSAAIKTQLGYEELPYKFSEDATIVARFGKYNNIKIDVSSEDDGRGEKSDHLKVGSNTPQSTTIVVDKRWKNEEDGMQLDSEICTAETGENDNHFVGWRLKNEKDCFSENPVLTYEALCKGIRSDKLASSSGEAYDKELARSHRYIVGDYNVLAVFEPIRGHIGFNLVNECDHFSTDVMSKNELETGDKSTKYIYSPTTYALYDKFDVPSNYVPECNNNQHIFIGWYDKEHKVDKKNDYKNTTGTDYVHTSRILQPGTTEVEYARESKDGKGDVQTLDALYISIRADKGVKKVYDGKPYIPEYTIEHSWKDPKYKDDIDDKLGAYNLDSSPVESKTADGNIVNLDTGIVDVTNTVLTHTLKVEVAGRKAEAMDSAPVEITPRPVTVTAEEQFTYDGTEKTLKITKANVSTEDSTDCGVVSGQTLALEASIKAINVGKYTYIVSYDSSKSSEAEITVTSEDRKASGSYKVNNFKITDATGNDVTHNYNVTITGTLIIKKATPTGTVEQNGWVYGEDPLPANATLTGSGLAGNPAPDYFEYKVKDAGEETVAKNVPKNVGNYQLRAVWEGTDNYNKTESPWVDFSITPRPIELYREETHPHTKEKWTLTIDPKNDIITGFGKYNLMPGDTLTLENASITGQNIGEYEKFDKALTWTIKNTGGDVSKNYAVTISGKLIIRPSVTYVFNADTKTKDTITNEGNPEYYEPGKKVDLKSPVYTVSNGDETKKYDFVAWYTDRECTARNKRDAIGIDGDTDDITLYAKWKAVGRVRYWLQAADATWNLAADSNIIDDPEESNPEHYIDEIPNYTDGENIYFEGTTTFSIPATEPIRAGYTFDGWRHEANSSYNDSHARGKNLSAGSGPWDYPYDGNWKIDKGEIIPDRLTLKAQWTPYTYTVTFDANGGTSTGTAVSEQSFTYDKDGILNVEFGQGDTATHYADFMRFGYIFTGWSTKQKPEAGDPIYHNGDIVSNWAIGGGDIVWPETDDKVADNAELTLYAVWTPNTYKATFHKNYGTEDEKQTVDYTYDAEGTLNPKEAFTRPGYKFSGWAITQEAAAAKYPGGEAVSNWKIGDDTDIAWPNSDGIVGDGANLDLYAVWTADFTGLRLEGFTQKYDGKVYSVKITGNLPGDTVTYYRDAANNSANKLNVDQVTAKNVGESIEQVYAVVTRGKESTTLGPVAAKITPREVTLTSGTASKKYDGEPLKAETVTVSGDGFVEGEGADYTAFASRTLVGSSDNTFSYTLRAGTDINNYQISTVTGTLTVADEPVDAEDTTPVDPTLVVSKTHGVGSALYEAGQTVTFTIRVKNIYDAVKTITLMELAGTTFVAKDGAALSGNGTVATFENVAAGAEVEITAIHVITDADVAKGTFENNVTVAFSGEDPKFTGHDEAKVDQNCTYTVEFRNQLGETIHDSIGPFTVPYGTVITGATTTAIGGTTVAYKDIKITGYKYLSTGGNLTVTSDTESNVFIVYYQADMEGVHAHGFRKTYDGQEYAVSVSGNLPGDVITYTYQKPGTSETVISTSPVRARNVADSVAEVTVTIRRGAVTTTEKVPAVILPRKIVLESASLEKEFDGDPLMNGSTPLVRDGYKNVGPNEGWVKGEGYIEEDLFFYGGITEPGNCPNVFGYTLKDGTQGSNYDIVITEGTLTVKDRSTPYELTVEANSGTFTYDGTEKTVSGLIEDRFVVNGYPYHVTGLEASVTKTDAGTYTIEITGTPRVEMVAERGLDVTKQFTVHFIPGKMTIAPRPVTLTSGSSSKEYDGQPLTNDNVTAVGFVGDDGAEYQVSGSQTLVGSSQNKYTYKLKTGTLASNYTITQQYGTLTVNNRTKKLSIAVRARSATYTYDGTEKKENRLARQTFEINGRQFTVEGLTVSGQGTNAGTYDVTVSGTAVVRDEDGNDVTAQFDVSTTGGKLTINKRPLTLKSASIERKWDGSTPLTNGDMPLDIEDGWVDGEGATYTFTGSQTGVGENDNTFDISPKSGTNLDNYELDKQVGKLKITNRSEGEKYPITVKARSASYLYDGTEKKEEGFETLSFRINGEQYTVSGLTALGSGKDAASYTVQVTGDAVVKDTAGNDVTAQFNVTSESGTLTIRKRTVVLKSADKTKVYDGTELTNGDTPLELDGIPDAGLADEGDGWAVGEGAVYTFNGSQTVVGSIENKFSYVLQSGTKADNYEITCQFGTLTVTDRTEKFVIDVTAASGEYTYDGTEKTVSGLTGLTKVPEAVDDEWTFKINGQIYTLSGLKAEGKGKDAGTYTVSITGTEVVKDSKKHDVTGEFTVVRHDGKLTIRPRDIVLISDSATQMFDPNMLLSRPDVTILSSEDNFVNGEAEVTAIGEILYVGNVTNTIIVNGKAGSGYNEENYHITKREGTLRVTDGSATNPLDPSMVVTKEHDEAITYKAGDIVTFMVSATNIYNETKTMTLTELEGVTFADTFTVKGASAGIQLTLSEQGQVATFTNVPAGETVEIKATYTIADADVANGGFTNAVTVEFSGPRETKTFTGKDTVDRIDRDCCVYTVRFVEKNSAGRAANEEASDLHTPIKKTNVKYGTRVDGDTVTDDGTPYSEIEIPGYVFAETNGPLTVTTEEEDNVLYLYYEADFMGLDATGVDKAYDGEKSSVSVSGTIEGDKVTYTYTVIKDDGTEQKMTTDDPLTLKNVKDSVKGDVTVTVERGGFTWTKKVPATITARKVTLQSADLSKKYDGQPLVNGNTPLVLDGVADSGEALAADEGWATGDSVSYKFTGSQTEVGASANSFEVVAGEGTDLANYAIEKREGKLTVTAADPVQTESQKQTETETKKPSESETEKTKTGAKLTVTKSIISEDDGHLLGLDGAKFYVALFSDAKLTKLAGEIRELDFDLNTAVASVVYRNLKPGTYYVAEVNAKGKVVKSGKYGGGVYAANYESDAQKVTIKKDDSSVKFAFENRFLQLPEVQYYRDLGLPKDSKNGNSKSKPEDEQETEPESGAQANGTGAVGAGTEAAKTGDGTPIERMLLLLAASGMLLILTEKRRRRSQS